MGLSKSGRGIGSWGYERRERVQQSRIPDAMRRGMPHKNDLVVVILFDVFNVWNAVFGERAGVSPGAYAIQMDG